MRHFLWSDGGQSAEDRGEFADDDMDDCLGLEVGLEVYRGVLGRCLALRSWLE